MKDNSQNNPAGDNLGTGNQSSPPVNTSNNPAPANPPGAQDVAMQTGGMQNYLSSQKPQDSNVVIPAGLAKRSVRGKIIATVLGIVLLVGGVAAGVLLVQRQQEFREKATVDDICTQSPNCFVIDNPGDSGSFPVEGIVFNVYLTADQVHSFTPTVQDVGCYSVEIEDDHINWERQGTDPECEEIFSLQVWMLEDGGGGEEASPIEAICNNIIIYDTEWNQLSADDLGELAAGDTIRLAVGGSTNEGEIDMVKFTINETELAPTSTKRDDTGEFYEEYVVPEGIEQISVSVQMHHTELGWF